MLVERYHDGGSHILRPEFVRSAATGLLLFLGVYGIGGLVGGLRVDGAGAALEVTQPIQQPRRRRRGGGARAAGVTGPLDPPRARDWSSVDRPRLDVAVAVAWPRWPSSVRATDHGTPSASQSMITAAVHDWLREPSGSPVKGSTYSGNPSLHQTWFSAVARTQAASAGRPARCSAHHSSQVITSQLGPRQ